MNPLPLLKRRPSGARICGLAIALSMLLLFGGCATPPTVPVASLSYQIDPAKQQRNLLVLLRGIGADHRVFEKEGLIDEIKRRGLPFDVIAPDLHEGYYEPGFFETRLKEDIIDPARRQGYQKIWLAGFSMGGLGSLIYLRSHPQDVDGVLLVSPFLGWPGIHREIRRAGGIDRWTKTADDPDDWERMIWSWIKQHDFSADPPIWLGYGNGDMITAAGPAMLASRLAPDRAFSTTGNHNIATMKAVFLHQLDLLGRQTALIVAVPTPP
jgi:pimeloyl-ACP methyl ester carboxylesterase